MTSVGTPWPADTPGLLMLPSGRLVRGRALAAGVVPGSEPDFGLYLAAVRPAAPGWRWHWLCWPDFWLPLHRAAADRLLTEAWQWSETERVEIGCRGGRGRTGTALACLSVFDGLTAAEAIDHVRRHYHPRAVETPWQRRWVDEFRDRVHQ